MPFRVVSRIRALGAPAVVVPSAIALLVLLVIVVAAPVLAPYDPDAQHRDAPFAPPTAVHLFVPGRWVPTRPFVDIARDAAERQVPAHAPIVLWHRETVDGMNGVTATRTRLFGVDPPAYLFLLGSDRYGRDRLSRLLVGARISLGGGLLAAAVSVGLGLLLGGVAGFRGGVADRTLVRVAALFLAVPWLYLLLALRAALPLDLPPTRTLLLLAATIGLAGWARPALLVRAVVLSGRSRGYVEAARSSGASEWFVLRRHILPQALIVVVTQAAMLAPQFALAEMTLSFLGLGVNEPLASWGTLLADVSRDHLLEPSWYVLAPVMVVIAVFILFQRAADAVIERASEVTA